MFWRYLSKTILLGAVLAFSPAAQAGKIYRYVNADGVTVITNVAPGKSKKSVNAKPKVAVPTLSGSNASDSKSPGKKSRQELYDPYIEQACALYQIPSALARAVITAESAYNPAAVSVKGAVGLMQLMPETAAEMFVSDRLDPKQNINGGIRYLRVLSNMFNGDIVRTVAAYNAGPEAVRRANGIPLYAETQEYVRRVLFLYFFYRSQLERQ